MARYILCFVLVFCWPEKGNTQAINRNFYQIQKEMEKRYSSPKKYDSSYKHWKRAEYYMQNRIGRRGEIVNTESRKWDLWQQTEAQTKQSSQRAYSGDWEFFGPLLIEGNDGIGRVNRIAFHPTDSDQIYVATAGGGLFYTFNHGVFWVPLTESLPVNNLSGVAVDYTDPDIIYILTGDGDGTGDGTGRLGLQKSCIGVLKSINGGQTWKQTGLIFDETEMVLPYDLVMHPEFPEILLVAANTGVYLTLNSGETWTRILTARTYELHFKPDQPNIIFAVSDEFVYRSSTLGIIWDPIAIPLYDSDDGRMTLTPCPSNPDVLYLVASPGIDSTADYRGLFISTDAGLSFTMVSDTPNVVDDQGWYDLTMICNPADVNDLLVGVVSIWKSTNGGVGIQKVGGTHADIHDFQINPINGRLYAGTDGGLYYSDDFGDTWTFMSELCPITQYYKIAVSQQDADIVIGGTQDNGTNRNLSGATTVMDKILGKDGMDCSIHPLDDSYMIYSSQNGEFWISSDQGNTEDSLLRTSSLPSTVKDAWVTPIAWDPTDQNNIYLGYGPIYRSFDMGASFEPVPDTVSGRQILYITPANNQRLYAGDFYAVDDTTSTFHLWTSTNQGDTWSALHTSPTFPDTTLIVSGLSTLPSDDQEVWITLGGWEEGEKVYRSLDAGMTWINMSGSLPNTPINEIILDDPGGSPAYAVYIGTDIGIYYMDDILGDWIPFSNGLPIVEVTDLEINASEGKIHAGTYGRGIWTADLFSSCEAVLAITPVLQRDDQSYFFQASDTITSPVPIHNSYGIRVTYRSGNAVVLEEGFRATSNHGVVFRALNGDCDEGGVPLPIQSLDLPALKPEDEAIHEKEIKPQKKSE